MSNVEQDFEWSAVIARCLAYICLQNSKYVDAQVLDQAEFLKRMGLRAADIADVLGSSRESLRVLSHLAKKKKGASKNGKAKRS
jgi:hypothetical protein